MSDNTNSSKLGISLVSNLFAMLVSLGVSFLLTPFLIENIGKDAYSFFPLANNFIGYLNVITIALNSMAARFITVSRSSGDLDKSKAYFSTVFFGNIIVCVILLLPMVLIIWQLQNFLDIPLSIIKDIKILFAFMFAALDIQLITSVFGTSTFSTERMDLYALQSIGQNLLRAVLFIVLFTVLTPSIVIMGIVTLVLSIYNGIAQICFSKKLLPDYKIKPELFNKAYLKILLSSGVWNSIYNIGTSLLQTMVILMANVLVSANAAGDLSIVQTLPNLMTTVICSVYAVLLPRIANEYAKQNSEKTIATVCFTQKILGFFSSVPVVLIILFGKQFYLLWVPGEDASYLQKISIISIIPLLVHSSMWTVYGLNVMNNKVKVPALVFLSFGILNVLMTYILTKLIPNALIIIPLVSSLLNTIYYLCFMPFYSAKKIEAGKFTFYPHIIKTFIFSAVCLCIFYPILTFFEINSWIKFFLYGGFIGILCELLYMFIVLDKTDRRSFTLSVSNKIRNIKRK